MGPVGQGVNLEGCTASRNRTDTTFLSTDVLSIILRIAVGVALFLHGLPKVRGGWRQSGQWMKSMGVPPFAAVLVTILESLGGVFLVVGLLVPLVAGFFVIQFACIIAMKVVKMKAVLIPGSSGKPSYEIDLTYLLLSVALLFLGAGPASLDSLLGV